MSNPILFQRSWYALPSLLFTDSNRTNFANDYFDFVKGADSKRDRAPVRMVSSGIIKPRTMLIASCLVFLLSFAVGVYIMLSVNGSRYLLLVGLFSVLFGLCYTGDHSRSHTMGWAMCL